MAVELTFNPFDMEWRADRYPFFQRLRREAPVGQVPGLGVWYLTRYADCDAVLRDRRAGVDVRKSPLYRMLEESATVPMPEELAPYRSFLILDPPDHTRLRGLVSKAFTPRVVQRLAPRIERLTHELLDRALERRGGSLELIEDLAYPLPFDVICELVGVPVADYPLFRAWSKVLATTIDPRFDTPPEELREQHSAMLENVDYFSALVRDRRRQPGEDLLSALIEVQDGSDRLTHEELVATLILLVAAGHETTVNLIGNAVVALLQHPEELARLRADPGLTASAVQEVLRWDPPAQLTQRIALEQFELPGGEGVVEEGMPIILLIAAANRDEAVVEDGERLDVGRSGFRHLTFSAGLHHCLGAALGSLEGEIALNGLISRLPHMRMIPDSLTYRHGMVLRGPESVGIEG